MLQIEKWGCADSGTWSVSWFKIPFNKWGGNVGGTAAPMLSCIMTGSCGEGTTWPYSPGGDCPKLKESRVLILVNHTCKLQ